VGFFGFAGALTGPTVNRLYSLGYGYLPRATGVLPHLFNPSETLLSKALSPGLGYPSPLGLIGFPTACPGHVS